MKAQALYEAGRLDEAIEVLGAELRDDPTDARRRTFLFELLCFAGDFERAGKHLEIVAGSNPEAGMGAWLYRSALHAASTREDMFGSGAFPEGDSGPAPVSGTLNGRPFESLQDADPRLGARLEFFAAGEYTWMPLQHLASVRIEPPRRLRDLLWTPATVQTGPGFERLELGEVLLPVLSPLTFQDPEDAVRLGRMTAWVEDGGLEFPLGQKLFLVDGEEIPILEIRELEIAPSSSSAD
jgi:type VI secretion system protein ImpE